MYDKKLISKNARLPVAAGRNRRQQCAPVAVSYLTSAHGGKSCPGTVCAASMSTGTDTRYSVHERGFGRKRGARKSGAWAA